MTDDEYGAWPEEEKQYHSRSELSKSRLFYEYISDSQCSVACIAGTTSGNEYGRFTDIELIILELKLVNDEWLIDGLTYRTSLGNIQDVQFFF